LLDVCHATTLAKVGADADPARAPDEVEAINRWAGALSFAMLHRLWQMLLKGHDEVSRASDANEAADMAVLRMIHASQMPDPAELARKIESGDGFAATPAPAPASGGGAPRAALPADFPALIRLLERSGKRLMAQQLHDYVGVVNYAAPEIELRPVKPLPADFEKDVATALKSVTGELWRITLTDAPAAPSLLQQQQEAENAARDAILADPLIKTAMEHFPEAELVSWETPEQRSADA
jgi:DNA polymerase III subunit gamma/tau